VSKKFKAGSWYGEGSTGGGTRDRIRYVQKEKGWVGGKVSLKESKKTDYHRNGKLTFEANERGGHSRPQSGGESPGGLKKGGAGKGYGGVISLKYCWT